MLKLFYGLIDAVFSFLAKLDSQELANTLFLLFLLSISFGVLITFTLPVILFFPNYGVYWSIIFSASLILVSIDFLFDEIERRCGGDK